MPSRCIHWHPRVSRWDGLSAGLIKPSGLWGPVVASSWTAPQHAARSTCMSACMYHVKKSINSLGPFPASPSSLRSRPRAHNAHGPTVLTLRESRGPSMAIKGERLPLNPRPGSPVWPVGGGEPDTQARQSRSAAVQVPWPGFLFWGCCSVEVILFVFTGLPSVLPSQTPALLSHFAGQAGWQARQGCLE